MTVEIRLEPLIRLVSRHPGWVPVLEEFGIDGRGDATVSLAAAADRAGADIGEVIAALSGEPHARWDCSSIASAPVRAIIEHIERSHHDDLRGSFSVITRLLDDARRGDSAATPPPADLGRLFTELRAHMEPHLLMEETTLFPLCRDIADAFSWPSFYSGPIDNPIELVQHEHDHATGLIGSIIAIVESGDGMAWEQADPRLVEALTALDANFTAHLHEEETVLFPTVLRLAQELEASSP